MNSQQENDVRPDIAFLIELCNYLGASTNLDESLKQILVIKNKPDTPKLEKTLLQLILDLNPKTKTFKSPPNQTLIIDVIKYLINIKKKKENANPLEIFNIFARDFSEDPLYIKLFEKDDALNDIKEIYLEMIIPFVPEKRVNLIINVMKNYTNKEELKFVEQILYEINLKIEESFLFLKKIIIGVINSKENLKEQIQGIIDNFLDNEKNELFRCTKCYSFPILYTDGNDPNKTVKIKYSCSHFHESDILEQEKVRNTKPQCSHCNKVLSIIHHNYLCSNCKKLVCNYCKQTHFYKCLTLFFIPFSDIGLICAEHNKNYETFCSICEMNLCSLCKQEHIHFSNYSRASFSSIDKEKISNYINSNDNINEAYKNVIRLIISNIKYFDNLQFLYFLDNLLEQKTPLDCGFFETFGNELFDKYYFTLINEYEKGSPYYAKIYKKIKDAYKEKNIKINIHECSSDLMLIRLENDSKNLYRNSLKNSLLFDYFSSLNEIDYIINEEKNKSLDDILKIKKEKSEITSNTFAINNNEYKVSTIKLLNRCIANNILHYLISTYPNNFRKISFELNIYEDIKKNFGEDNELFKNFERKYKNEILNYIERMKSKLTNTPSNSSADTDNTENNNNDIKFINSITNKNKTISVEDLNILLEYLFYLKNQGNDMAHPNEYNYKNKISLKENVINKDADKNNYNKNDISAFTNNLLNFFQNYKFKNKITNKCLLDCLFENKYENLLSEIESAETQEIKDIIEQGKNSNFQNEINDEFKKLDKSVDYFKSLNDSLIDYNDKKSKKHDSLSKFYERLYENFANKKSIMKLLITISNMNYENCLIDNITMFISECLNHIIFRLLQKHENIIKELENQIQKIKIERNNNRIILETFKKLNEKTTEIEGQSKKNNKDLFLNGLLDHLNKQKSEEEDKIDYSQGSQILNLIKNNLEILLIGNVNWSKNREANIDSLLCLYQSQS